MGWFVTQGRKHPSITACAIGAAIGITLGNLVVPSTEERIASGTHLVTTEAASTPSQTSDSAMASGLDATAGPGQDPDPTGSATVEESTQQSDRGDVTSAGADGSGEADQDGSGDHGQQGGSGADADRSTSGDSSPDTDRPDDSSSDPPKMDEPSSEPPETSNPPDEPEPTDSPEEPSPSPTLDPPNSPSPTPSDPPDREEYCLGLDLSLLELLLCLD